MTVVGISFGLDVYGNIGSFVKGGLAVELGRMFV